MKILHLPLNIANQPGYIARAQRRLGHDAEVWEFGKSGFAFPVDRTLDISTRDARVLWDAFLEAIERFDVFHFNFGRSFFSYPWSGVPPLWDLPVLRALGKKVFFTFHGSDCRTKRIHLEVNPWSYLRFSDIDPDDDQIEKTVQVVRTYANKMFITALGYTHFVPDAELQPRTIDLSEWPQPSIASREVPRILHVPSRRGTKGTEFVVEGLRQLEEEGLKFDFRLLEGVPHAEAKAAIEDADIVVDNLVSGDYEIVSIETMASGGVPVAQLDERIKEAYPDAPVWDADPATFVDRMRTLLEAPELRRSLAARGREYVSANHDVPLVAEKLLGFYEQEAKGIPTRVFPDWTGFGSARRVEQLEQRLLASEATRARLTKRVEDLNARLGRRDFKDMLPPKVRLALRRARARLSGRLRAR